VAIFTYSPSTPVAGTVIAFDASASSDPDGTIVSYAWSFGDGSTASVPSPSHAYVASGSYSVQLTVTDNGGRTAQVARTVVVSLSDEAGWISPVAFSDPDNRWSLEERAYDNDVARSGAWVSVPGAQWSPYLILTLPGSGVLSDRLRIYVADSHPSPTHVFTWTIEGLVDAAWVQIYQGKPAVENQWVELAFAQATITQIRVRAHNDTGGQWRLWLTEIDAHDSTAGP
jgi:PKD repeat protein